MRTGLGILLALTAVAASPALAQQGGGGAVAMEATAPGEAAAASVVTVSALVTAVDKAARVVTLKGPSGNTYRVVAGPEVRNLDQIKVGDEVVVRHLEAVVLELTKGGGGVRERVESAGAERAPAGGKPGAMVVRRVTVVADVVAVNPRSQTVTLRGPEHTVDLRVRDPEQFKLVKVGDQVQATFTDAVAISVEPAARR